MAAVQYPWFLEKVENSAGTVSYTFPTEMYELEMRQGLRVPSAALVGADFDLDLLGSAVAPKESGRARLRFIISDPTVANVETEIDTLREKIYGMGVCKVYIINAAGTTRRWAWGRPVAMPDIDIRIGQVRAMAVALEFRWDSAWYSTTLTEEGEAINADPDTITITNPGNTKVKDAIITIRGTFTNPSVSNSTSGYSFSSTRDGSDPDHWLKIDSGRHTVEFSTDGGSTYADDIALFTRGATQVAFMHFLAGDNTLVITGCNGATIDVDFYGANH